MLKGQLNLYVCYFIISLLFRLWLLSCEGEHVSIDECLFSLVVNILFWGLFLLVVRKFLYFVFMGLWRKYVLGNLRSGSERIDLYIRVDNLYFCEGILYSPGKRTQASVVTLCFANP